MDADRDSNAPRPEVSAHVASCVIRVRELDPSLKFYCDVFSCKVAVRETDMVLLVAPTLLARLARFVIADLTGAPQLPQVFEAFVPEVAVPVLPIDSSKSARKTGFTDAWKYSWYLSSARYETTAQLAELLTPEWFERAERKRHELRAH
jgi:hypothetical protein